MGCDYPKNPEHVDDMVSIHAPVWGATFETYNPANDQAVSIHAPVWGATGVKVRTDGDGNVSIHAPVWGATTMMLSSVKTVCFNPRTRVGCDRVV